MCLPTQRLSAIRRGRSARSRRKSPPAATPKSDAKLGIARRFHPMPMALIRWAAPKCGIVLSQEDILEQVRFLCRTRSLYSNRGFASSQPRRNRTPSACRARMTSPASAPTGGSAASQCLEERRKPVASLSASRQAAGGGATTEPATTTRRRRPGRAHRPCNPRSLSSNARNSLMRQHAAPTTGRTAASARRWRCL